MNAAANPAATSPPAPGTPPPNPTQTTGTEGLSENVAGALAYVLGWITGLVFLLVDKRPSVRFHAAQSIVIFGALNIVMIFLGGAFLPGVFSSLWTLFYVLREVIGIIALVLWVVLMVKAYQGQQFRVPYAAEFADSLQTKVKS